REIARLAALGYAVDPHGAVASAVLRLLLQPGERGLFLGTAHPAKFEVSGAAVPLPPALAAALRRPLLSEPLPATEAALHAALAAWPV
nr:threonine synthase [Thermoanaerobaculia bacterium]